MECYGLGSVLESVAAAPAAPGRALVFQAGIVPGPVCVIMLPPGVHSPFPQIGLSLASALGYNN